MSASKDTLSCPVCKLDGFVIAELPQTCPQCGWRVELLIGQISEAYRAKLAAAREEWQAGGAAQGRLKRLAGLFERIDAAWKTGRWTEVLGLYDEILKLNPDNSRAARERPAALFCLMESLFLDFARTRRDQLRQASERDQAERDKRRAEAAQFESVGMRPEAQEATRKAEALEQTIAQRQAEAQALTESLAGTYTKRWQKDGPESLPDDDDELSFVVLLSGTSPSWMEAEFHRRLWRPFSQQARNLPQDQRDYVEEFRRAYDVEIQRLNAERKAEADRTEQARLDEQRRRLNEQCERERTAARRAAQEKAEQTRAALLKVALWGAGVLLAVGVAWGLTLAWPLFIFPALIAFIHSLILPLGWSWHYQLIVVVMLSLFCTVVFAWTTEKHQQHQQNLILKIIVLPAAIYAVLISCVISFKAFSGLGTCIAGAFSWFWDLF